MGWLKSSLFALLAAVGVQVGVDRAFQPTFPVHSSGAVVVTGASSGIGEHAAVALAKLGYTVFAGVRQEKAGDALKAQHPNIRPVVLDVTQRESINAAVGKVKSALMADNMTLVALVNNAGVQKDMPIELQEPESNRFNFEVNVFGMFDVTRAFLPLLMATGDGARIVNVGSVAGVVAAPGSASYSASKFAVEGINDALRLEMLDFGISVSLLQPGYVKSKMGTKAHAASADSYGVSDADFERYRRVVFDGFFAKDKALAAGGANPANSTTPAIVDAITSPTPRTRYPVAEVDGLPAGIVTRVKSMLPDRVMDYLTLNT